MKVEIDSNDQPAQRRHKLAELRRIGNAYPNDFGRDALCGDLPARYAAREAEPITVRIAGRLMTRRVMGKAAFAHLQDMSGRIQIYLRREDLPEGGYESFKQWDLGDIVGAEGTLFTTRTGELSVHVREARLLVEVPAPLAREVPRPGRSGDPLP